MIGRINKVPFYQHNGIFVGLLCLARARDTPLSTRVIPPGIPEGSPTSNQTIPQFYGKSLIGYPCPACQSHFRRRLHNVSFTEFSGNFIIGMVPCSAMGLPNHILLGCIGYYRLRLQKMRAKRWWPSNPSSKQNNQEIHRSNS